MGQSQYIPRPADTSGVELPTALGELTELLARHVHEVWAQGRMKEGWSYGPERSDADRRHPCLVAYEDLPESERDYDRQTAVQTLRLIVSLGYGIEKKKGVEAS